MVVFVVFVFFSVVLVFVSHILCVLSTHQPTRRKYADADAVCIYFVRKMYLTAFVCVCV